MVLEDIDDDVQTNLPSPEEDEFADDNLEVKNDEVRTVGGDN